MIFFLNAINLITVAVGFIVQIIIVRFFGASDSTDVYYLVITITTFVTGLSTGFLTDLFVPIYHDAKNRSLADAQELTGSILTLSLVTGIAVTAIVFLLSPVFISIFASGFPADKFQTASRMLQIISLSITFATISMVLNSTLNANSFLLATYLTNLIAPIFNVLGLFLVGKRFGVASLMYATVLASATTFSILLVYCKLKVGARFASPFKHKDIPLLLLKNIPVRGSNIVNMLRGPLTTTVLSYFPSGNLTLYSYAEKIISVLVGTTNSPLAQVYYIRSSEFASKKEFPEIRKLLLDTIKSSVVLFAGFYFITVVVFQKLFGIIFVGRVSPDGIRTMFLLLLALYPFYYATLLGTELGATGLAMKKGRLNLYASAVFIVVLGITIYPFVKWLSLFGLPLSLFAAQTASLFFYAKLVNKVEHLLRFEILGVQANTLVVSLLMIVVSFVTAGYPWVQVTADAVLMIVWIATNWNSAIDAMRMITAKGEVK